MCCSFIYLNSYFEAGIKSPLDDAVLKHGHPCIDEYKKLDEIPFDFNRKRLSVVAQHDENGRLLISKGRSGEHPRRLHHGDGRRQTRARSMPRSGEAAEDTFKQFSADGYRVLGVATREMPAQQTYAVADEQGMTWWVLPPSSIRRKPASQRCLQQAEGGRHLRAHPHRRQSVCDAESRQDVGLSVDNIITGSTMDGMDDAALAYQAEHGAIFARVSPEQKNRVITALKAHGRVVGYIGDGINDAPSLHAADIGISVVNGVDVAKDAASIILLEKDLGVLHDGVLEGRRSFANIMKYIIMGTSSNFGNMFSMAAASVFLPFPAHAAHADSVE